MFSEGFEKTASTHLVKIPFPAPHALSDSAIEHFHDRGNVYMTEKAHDWYKGKVFEAQETKTPLYLKHSDKNRVIAYDPATNKVSWGSEALAAERSKNHGKNHKKKK